VFLAARADAVFGFARGGIQHGADLGLKSGDDEKLGGEVAVVEEQKQGGVGFRNGERDVGFVVTVNSLTWMQDSMAVWMAYLISNRRSAVLVGSSGVKAGSPPFPAL
jgi:hypothetical protein